LKVQPRPDKYYLLELVSAPAGKYFEKEYQIHFDETSDGFPEDLNFTMKKWEKNELTFSLQLAKTYGRFTVRGGLIESTGGFGLDVDFFRRALRFTVEGWDFSRDSDPHLKIGGRWNLSENFYLTGGWDDPLLRSDDQDSIYFGAGLMLEDEDFKFLLGLLPAISGS
jgi:phospholipid/cholesterol/gamma-HCH transport system substrate-binding protein